MVEVVAEGKNIRVSPKKVRVVAEKLTGRGAQKTLELLKFVPKKAATPLAKILKSAIANAQNNNKLEPGKLSIKEILVNSGPTMKRFRPVSRGAAHKILKRTCHIKIILEQK